MTSVTLNVISLFALFLVIFSMHNPSHVMILVAAYVPVALIGNIIFVRRRVATRQQSLMAVPPRLDSSRSRYSYICAGMFILGTCYGILMLVDGEIPVYVIPLLAIPISLAIYCFRSARRLAGLGSSNPDERR